MRKHREVVILVVIVSVVAVWMLLDLKPAPSSPGRVYSAEPRLWLGAKPPAETPGLSVFGLQPGEDLEQLQARLPSGFSLSQVGESSNVWRLDGPHVKLFQMEGRWYFYDFGTLYLDGEPVSSAGATDLDSALQLSTDLQTGELGALRFSDQKGQRIEVFSRAFGERKIDFAVLSRSGQSFD